MTADSIATAENEDLEFIFGGIIGRMKDGNIINCHFKYPGKIEPSLTVGRTNVIGGIAGTIGGSFWGSDEDQITAPVTVKDSTASGNISVVSNGNGYSAVGGAFGVLCGGKTSNLPINIINCEYYDGTISFDKNNGIGGVNMSGFVGDAITNMNFINCRSRAAALNVTFSEDGGAFGSSIGGFTGMFRGNAEGCYSTTPINAVIGGLSAGNEIAIGGFIGTYSSFEPLPASGYWLTNRCYATGNVTVTVDSPNNVPLVVGGFIGRTSAPNIRDCYATGNVRVERTAGSGYTYAGGFAGALSGVSVVERCFSKGDVFSKAFSNSDDNNPGGLLGYIGSTAPRLISNVVLCSSVTRINGGTSSAQQNTPRRIGNASSTGGV